MTPPVIAGQPIAAKRSGCRPGCLIASLVALVLLVGGGFVAWRVIDDNVLPAIDEATSGFEALTETPPGPCYDLDVQDGLLVGWTEVSCNGPRQVEVTYAAPFTDGPFPGDEFLAEEASRSCPVAFETYVGVSPDRSAYGVDWLVPTNETWAQGNRQGVCLVVAGEGESLTGTIKGSEE